MITVKGIVVEGKKQGRVLGFPTANINIPKDIIIEPGIYAGFALLNKQKYASAIYAAGNGILEAFIFDFSQSIYGLELRVDVVKKIRDKKDFADDKEASRQINQDIIEIKKCLRELSKT